MQGKHTDNRFPALEKEGRLPVYAIRPRGAESPLGRGFAGTRRCFPSTVGREPVCDLWLTGALCSDQVRRTEPIRHEGFENQAYLNVSQRAFRKSVRLAKAFVVKPSRDVRTMWRKICAARACQHSTILADAALVGKFIVER